MESATTQPHILEVLPAWVEHWWEPSRDLIESACSYSGGRYMVQDVLKFLLSGHMQLWVIMDGGEIAAIAITELVNFPRLKECRVLAATGEDAPSWTHLISHIEEWALQAGCRKMMLVARPGWEKAMKAYGYEKKHVQLERDLGYVH